MQRRTILWWSAVAAILTAIWGVYVYQLDIVYAYRGQSAMAWVYRKVHPEWFTGAFPSLVDSYASSLAMYPYLWAYDLLGIPPESFYPIFLGGEVAILAGASLILFRTLFPTAPRFPQLLFVLLVICSEARNMNLARFGQPLFFGIYYNFAEAFRLAGVALFLRGHVTPAFALVGFAFMCHPVIGLIGFAFLIAASVVRPHGMTISRVAVGTLLFTVLGGAWVAMTTEVSSLAANAIPRDQWFELTRMGSYHWYPWNIGVFTAAHEEMLIPFLSFLLLFGYFWYREGMRDVDRLVSAGCLGLLALVPIGVLASEFEWNITLVKLALHRSNDLIISVGLAYVVRGLWADIVTGAGWRRVAACGLAAAPFFLSRPFFLLGSVLYTVRAWRWRPADRQGFTLFLGGMALLGLVAVYYVTGIPVPLASAAYMATPTLLVVIMTAAAVVTALERLTSWKGAGLTVVLGCALLSGPVAWLYSYHQNRPFLGSEGTQLARDYKEAQLWARENTPDGALFMTDPTIYYGWEDFSRRGSFGNVRAWVFDSWSYSSDSRAYFDGLKRFAEFGVGLDPYTGMRPSIDGTARLTEAVGERYYSLDDTWRRHIAETYGVQYFVYRRARFAGDTTLPRSYENDSFIVLAARGPGRQAVARE
jgi:hypothetical protein